MSLLDARQGEPGWVFSITPLRAAKDSADQAPFIATPQGDPGEVPATHARPVRIVIVDELRIFRDGLRLLLASDARLHVVADTASEEAATALVRELRPDILLLGSLPSDGAPVEMLRRLAAAHLSVRTILL